MVTRVADGVTGGLYPGDRAEMLEALAHALRHPGPLNDQIETHHSEESIRTFLNRLSAALTTPSPMLIKRFASENRPLVTQTS